MRSVADLSRHLVKDYDEVQTLLDRGNHLRYSQLLRQHLPTPPSGTSTPPPPLTHSSVSLPFRLSSPTLSLSVSLSLCLPVSLSVSLSLCVSLYLCLSMSPPPPRLCLSPFLVRFSRMFEADLALLLTPPGSFCIMTLGCLQGLKQRI